MIHFKMRLVASTPMLASIDGLMFSSLPRLTRGEATTIACATLLRFSEFNIYNGLVDLPFERQVPLRGEDSLRLSISSGDVLFVLGANGTGKSGLMQCFFNAHFDKARRISAHRQTWFEASAIALSPHQKQQFESNIVNSDRSLESRWKETYSSQRPDIAIYNLVDAQNVRARKITGAVDEGEMNLAKQLSAEEAPIAEINELLLLSNLPIVISIRENDTVLASKSDSEPFSIAELSDGERSAILLAADLLTVKPDTLILIDEPERHLHRSIISPLLTLLFAKRSDCAFVVSTHEVMLPLDNPHSQALLLRNCIFDQKQASAWDADLVPTDAEIDEDLKKDILGARRKMLFVEGVEGSLDKPLYSLVFPNASVVAKASCKDVERAVTSIRDVDNLHWIHAFGIVDNDGRGDVEIERLKARGIYALTVFSVASVYYHPKVQRAVTERHAKVTGEDALAQVTEAKDAALAAIGLHVQRLSERAAQRVLREKVFKALPGKKEIGAGESIDITLDVPGVVAAERTTLEKAIEDKDLALLIKRYPVRETPALGELVLKLGFQDRQQYESAVRTLLMNDEDTLHLVRSLFGSLADDIRED
ncbi:MAG: AAA family ATPase [Alphaproteobacteria bacterium]|nr:AAA family ATPase [Alphaproteobacteria bacterium]